MSAMFRHLLRSEVLDITISVASHISDWHVSPEESMSDHIIIRFNIGLNLDCSERKRNPRNTIWEGFNASLLRDPVAGVAGKPPSYKLVQRKLLPWPSQEE